MHESLQAELASLGNIVQAAAIPDACKQTARYCFRQLPALYDNLRQSSESRYADEITRLVQWVLKDLTTNQKASPESQRLADRIGNRLQVLHEQFGLSRLNLTPEKAPKPRPRKTRAPRQDKQGKPKGRP